MTSAILVLEDGTQFYGRSIGAAGIAVGEVVFNTAMTGYQEILSDPSYAHQLVTLTYPHIGNTGVNTDDWESAHLHARGLIIRQLAPVVSNFRSQEDLASCLQRHNVVAIDQIDTRKLTRLLREKGAMRGCIVSEAYALEDARAQLAAYPGLQGMDLAKQVSTQQPYRWTTGSWQLSPTQQCAPPLPLTRHVVVYDYGVKRNILRKLVDHGCHLTVVPAQMAASEVLALQPDGILLSNGPGDPQPCDYAIAAIKQLLATTIPLFGICLGHQLLALASGAQTKKMKLGHHGGNHPVQALADGTVMITAQNHGFAVDETRLPAHLTITHTSLFDHSVQGIKRVDKPAFGFQGHPEASPGPHDADPLFSHFIALIDHYQQRAKA